MKRNTLLIVVVAVAAFFLLFNPLRSCTGRSGSVPRPSAEPGKLASLLEFARSSWKSPEDYVVASFKSHDIVFLGEFYKIKQNVDLVGRLIPRLYAAGIRNLGVEYALSDDQGKIDALLAAPTWDEAGARAITFDWLVTWGYKEYFDLYKAAWQLNRSLPAGSKNFRIVGLSVRQNWNVLQTEKDASDPQKVAQMFAYGIPDAHMAEVIDSQFLKKGEKALVYTGSQHAFTRYRSAAYEKNAAAMGLSEIRRAGNIVAAKAPGRTFTISLHAPWPDSTQQGGLGYPADGVIDALIGVLPPEKQSAGWDTAGTPLGALSVKSSTYAAGADMTLADLFDGYIVQGPIGSYTAVTPIPDFVRPEDGERAVQNFPGVKSAALTPQQVNQSIIEDATAMGKMLAQFK